MNAIQIAAIVVGVTLVMTALWYFVPIYRVQKQLPELAKAVRNESKKITSIDAYAKLHRIIFDYHKSNPAIAKQALDCLLDGFKYDYVSVCQKLGSLASYAKTATTEVDVLESVLGFLEEETQATKKVWLFSVIDSLMSKHEIHLSRAYIEHSLIPTLETLKSKPKNENIQGGFNMILDVIQNRLQTGLN